MDDRDMKAETCRSEAFNEAAVKEPLPPRAAELTKTLVVSPYGFTTAMDLE
jgi:hypothetical protein